MQTFLPYKDFKESAKVLDRGRLGKQRVEALQVIKSLHEVHYGWKNHPASKMWKGFESSLVDYSLTMCLEWISRGYADTCFDKILELQAKYNIPKSGAEPFWLGDERVHSSHRANLLRKDYSFYIKYNWIESPDTPYYWPV